MPITVSVYETGFLKPGDPIYGARFFQIIEKEDVPLFAAPDNRFRNIYTVENKGHFGTIKVTHAEFGSEEFSFSNLGHYEVWM